MTLWASLSPELSATFFALLGGAFGSFGNMLAHRIPGQLSLKGRSFCPNCKHVLGWAELIPIAAYLCLGGKCRWCKKPIGVRYLLFEVFTIGLFLAAWAVQPQFGAALLLALIFWLLLLIALIDAKCQGIPDILSFPCIVLALVFSAFYGYFDWLGVVIGVGFFWLQWLVSWGRWIGSGDVLLALACSLIIHSWPLVITMIFLAYILGAAVALAMIIKRRKKHSDQIAFGPFLVTATIVIFLWGDKLLQILGV